MDNRSVPLREGRVSPSGEASVDQREELQTRSSVAHLRCRARAREMNIAPFGTVTLAILWLWCTRTGTSEGRGASIGEQEGPPTIVDVTRRARACGDERAALREARKGAGEVCAGAGAGGLGVRRGCNVTDKGNARGLDWVSATFPAPDDKRSRRHRARSRCKDGTPSEQQRRGDEGAGDDGGSGSRSDEGSGRASRWLRPKRGEELEVYKRAQGRCLGKSWIGGGRATCREWRGRARAGTERGGCGAGLGAGQVDERCAEAAIKRLVHARANNRIGRLRIAEEAGLVLRGQRGPWEKDFPGVRAWKREEK
ncbi:hypothetical protein DFH09DRAFT_1069574 [Mycena vulgaris]|nr:hypothetical protein DFH09DRAFT_1069574 [Mycena vulgaris]